MTETISDLILKQKKIAANELFGKKDKDQINQKTLTGYIKLGKVIAAVLAEFKCENCDYPENLTFHHVIERGNEKSLVYSKYVRQRYYFDNIAVLCRYCHDKIHYDFISFGDRKVPINRFIESIKKKSYAFEALI